MSSSNPKDKNMPREQTYGACAAGSSKATSASRTSICRRKRRPSRPEPGSLYDIMREHAGISLYVLPICWTDLHAKLLGADFLEQEPILTPLPGPRLCAWDAAPPSQIAQALSRDLTALLSPQDTRPFFKNRAIKNIMRTLFPATFSKPKSSAELDLYFGPRVFRKAIRLPVIWKHPESAGASFDSAITRTATSFDNVSAGIASTPCPSSPMIAYVSKSQLANIRRNLFRICPGPDDGDKQNTPISNLQQLRSKLLIPASTNHDAHYVAILLGLAQAYFYEQPSSRASSQSSSRSGKTIDMLPERFHDVKVQLLAHADDTAEFIVYTAVVSAAFLERFARPSRAPTAPEDDRADGVDTGMKISFARVPIWPVLGLKERLGRALGRDIAGDEVFECDDPDEIETWETKEEREQQRQKQLRWQKQQQQQQVKRRREDRDILAEMLNSSFEAEDDASCTGDDRPVLSPSAKRRCARAVNTLEVF